MISDEELFDLMLSVDQNTKRIPPGVRLLADAIYQLGRQHQRESDAALCDREADFLASDNDGGSTACRICAEAIRNNIGDLTELGSPPA